MPKEFFPLRGQKRLHVLSVARGDEAADLLLKNARVLDLVSGGITLTNIALSGEFIAGVGPDYLHGQEVLDLGGLYVVPGFIDAHMHVESSLMHPFEFEKITLPHGTTTIIADPHEITNVLGHEGLSWILRCAETMTQTMFVQVPSCVPSIEGLETNGATLNAMDLEQYRHHPLVLGLGEMMNIFGVIQGDDDVLAKLDTFEGYPLDGHAPMLKGKKLNAYRVCGIQNCHESITANEAREKLRIGMGVMLREGSAAKNLDQLVEIVSAFNAHQCMLCTDDRNPLDIQEEGHINGMIRRLIQQHKMPEAVAYRLSSYSTARHYGLSRLGLIAPGYVADMVMLSDLQSVDITEVYKAGRPLSSIELETSRKLKASQPPLHNSIQRNPITVQDTTLDLREGDTYRIIEVVKNEIITRERHIIFDEKIFEEHAILPIHVAERYGKNIPLAHGLVMGFGHMEGAIATSVAHDSHNLMVLGKKASDRAYALNRLIQVGGGIVVVKDGRILAETSLPIAGLMSTENGENLAHSLTILRQSVMQLGCTLHEPFVHMSFLALPVIPELKITDKGLIQVSTQTPVSLKVE